MRGPQGLNYYCTISDVAKIITLSPECGATGGIVLGMEGVGSWFETAHGVYWTEKICAPTMRCNCIMPQTFVNLNEHRVRRNIGLTNFGVDTVCEWVANFSKVLSSGISIPLFLTNQDIDSVPLVRSCNFCFLQLCTQTAADFYKETHSSDADWRIIPGTYSPAWWVLEHWFRFFMFLIGVHYSCHLLPQSGWFLSIG